MRIFITGGTGFIGRYTVAELVKRKHRILALSADTQRAPGAEMLRGNLSNVAAWKEKLKKFKPDAVIHLAWEGILDFSYAQSAKNLQYGIALFNVLAEAGCKKIVAAGTGFECGDRVGRIPDEIPVVPTTPFTAAKHSLHLMGNELAKEKGMDLVWLRPYNPYGDGQRAGSLIPYIMRCVAGNAPLVLKQPLAQGDFVYITDVARAIADAVERGKGRVTYNVGSGYLTPVRDIAKLICEGMGASNEYYRDFARTAKGELTNAAYAELKNVRKGIGWHPIVGIEAGIQKTIRDHEAR